MKKTAEVKERIIEVTIALIQSSNGNAASNLLVQGIRCSIAVKNGEERLVTYNAVRTGSGLCRAAGLLRNR